MTKQTNTPTIMVHGYKFSLLINEAFIKNTNSNVVFENINNLKTNNNNNNNNNSQ